MIFSSYPYLVFFAFALLIFLLIESRLPRYQRAFLLLVSLIFYAWWRIDFLALLLGSALVNFAVGTQILRCRTAARSPQSWLLAGLMFNLALIAVFKYAGLFTATANNLLGLALPIPQFFLPLAISFFTFEQISYLVDAARGQAPRYSWLDYSLFVSFFPHLIAGPIIRHGDLIPQFHSSRERGTRDADIALGLTLFTIGLAKKVLIADTIAPYADTVFSAANHGVAIGAADAWLGTLFFTFQIYFDFSGYTDMALGSACAFGIRLPFNFNSPYKAASIIDFWRRWHISLSSFLRDYLYIGLGGNQRGVVRRYGNLFTTMLLGGLWHGASWTFVIWGGLHGFYLIVNHAWRHLVVRYRLIAPAVLHGALSAASVVITFAATFAAWVVFRAESVASAANIFGGLLGRGGDSQMLSLDTTTVVGFVLLFAIIWFAPNSMQMTWRYRPAMPPAAGKFHLDTPSRLAWQPSRGRAVLVGVIALVSLLAISSLSPFIYFQF